MSPLQCQIRGKTALLTLNRPQNHNALNGEMRAVLLETFRSIEEDHQLEALVITGSGQGFCAGADVKENLQGKAHTAMAQYTDIIRFLKSSRLVSLAAVNGLAAGIGNALAMTCDMVFIAPHARFSFYFSKLGLIADGGLHWELVRAMGYKQAFSLLTQGGELSAQQCLGLGLVNGLIEEGRLVDETLATAQSLANNSAQVLRTRQCLRHAQRYSFEDSLDLEAKLQMELFQPNDQKPDG